jgi:hypothetical protein
MPGPGYCLVYNSEITADPKHGQIEGNEEHVNGCANPRFVLFDEQQSFPRIQVGSKHQPAQFAKKGFTVSHPGWGLDQACSIVYGYFGGHLVSKRRRLSAAIEDHRLFLQAAFFLRTFSTLSTNSCGLKGLAR